MIMGWRLMMKRGVSGRCSFDTSKTFQVDEILLLIFKQIFMLTLKSVLLINGISSAVTGAGLVAFARQVALIFELEQYSPFVYTGIFLMIFGLYVVRTALSKTIRFPALRLVSALDIIWILASVTVVGLAGSRMSVTGNVLIILVAAWVGLMVVLQSGSQKQLTTAKRA
jgi:hypothetical protein